MLGLPAAGARRSSVSACQPENPKISTPKVCFACPVRSPACTRDNLDTSMRTVGLRVIPMQIGELAAKTVPKPDDEAYDECIVYRIL